MRAATLAAILVCTPVGLSAGYFLGRRVDRQARAEQAHRIRETASAAGATGLPKPARPSTPGDSVPDARLVPTPKGFEDLGLDEILSAAGPMDRFQAILSWIQRAPKEELEPALKKLRGAMQGRFDPEALFASHLLLTRYGGEDPKGAMAYLKSLDVWGQSMGTGTVLGTLATKDPQAAAEFFKDETNPVLNIPQANGFIAGAVAREWARKDPEGALNWARGLTDGLRGGALSSLIGSMAVEDPLKAAKTAADLNLDPGEDRNRVFGQVAQSWAARDPQAALAWVDTLPAGESRDEATRRSLDSWANTDPAAAAAHLSQVPDPAEQQKLMGAVTGPWARRDPAAAATWLTGQPEGKGREEGVRNVMWTWTNTDPTAASTWLNTLPAGPSKDEGIIALANQTGTTDPEAALSWAATVQDPTRRQMQLQRGIDAWMKRDQPAAQAWVQSSPSLSDAERARWLTGGK